MGLYGTTATEHQDTQMHRGGHHTGARWVIRPETSRAGGEGAHSGRGRDTQPCGPTRSGLGLESLETPGRARASSCQEVGTTWFFSSCGADTSSKATL